MKTLIVLLLSTISTLAQNNISLFLDTKNSSNNINVEVYQLKFDLTDSINIKLDTIEIIDTYIYSKIDENSIRFSLKSFSQYLIKLYDAVKDQEKYITVFTGNKNINKTIIADFNTQKQIAIMYNPESDLYEYWSRLIDSVLKEEVYKLL